MNPYNPTTADLALIESLCYERISALTREANKRPARV